MELELFYAIESELNRYLIPNIKDLIFEFAEIDYNQIIEKYIEHERYVRFYIATTLRIEFGIDEKIRDELLILSDHLPYIQQPKFVYIKFDKTPNIDFSFEIIINSYVWEILDDPPS